MIVYWKIYMYIYTISKSWNICPSKIWKDHIMSDVNICKSRNIMSDAFTLEKSFYAHVLICEKLRLNATLKFWRNRIMPHAKKCGYLWKNVDQHVYILIKTKVITNDIWQNMYHVALTLGMILMCYILWNVFLLLIRIWDLWNFMDMPFFGRCHTCTDWCNEGAFRTVWNVLKRSHLLLTPKSDSWLSC